MPDSSLYSKIKDFLPVAAAAGIGALAGGGPGAMAAAGGAAGGEMQQQALQQSRAEKALQIASLIQERKARLAQQQQALQERSDFQKAQLQQRADIAKQTLELRRDSQASRDQQNHIMDLIAQGRLDEQSAQNAFMRQFHGEELQNQRDRLQLEAAVAGRKGSEGSRMDAAVGTLSMLGLGSPGEVGMAISHAGLSANGATYVATRAAELMRSGKKVDLPTLLGEAGKTKDQYGKVLDNVASAMNDPKADAAKLLGPGAYTNYLLSKAKLGTLPPAERTAAERKIRQFALASIKPADPKAAKGWKPPSYDDLAALMSPSAPPASESPATPDKLGATEITGGEPGAATKAAPAEGGKAPAAVPVGVSTGRPDGDYQMGGKIYTVKGGKIVGVRDAA